MWTLPLRRLRSVACAAVVASCLSVTAAQAQISIVEGGASFKFPVTTFRDIPFRTVVRQQYDFSCGSAAVATLLNYHYGQPITEADVFRAMYAIGDKDQIRKVGFSLFDMKQFLEARGLFADGYRLTLADLEKAEAPAIAVVVIGRYRHFVVIKGVRHGKVLVGDPAQGLKTYTEAEFGQMWNGIVFMVHPRDDIKARYNRPDEWSVWPHGPLDDGQLAAASTYGPVRELPPMYQVSDFREIVPPSVAASLAPVGQ